MTNKDATDAVALIGGKEDIQSYAKEMGEEDFAEDISDMGVERVNREKDGLLAVDINKTNSFNPSSSNGAGFVIAHGVGAHLGGVDDGINLYDSSDDIHNNTDNSIYQKSQRIYNQVKSGVSLQELSKNSSTTSKARTIRRTFFRSKKPVDNYQKNKELKQ